MKKLFVLIILLSLLIPATAFANGPGQTIIVKSATLHYSGTGWAGWSCPKDYPFVISAMVTQDNDPYYFVPDFPLGISQPAKPGVGTYPVYSHYTYTPPEEGWVVQNGGTAQSLIIWVTCSKLKPVPPPSELVLGRPLFNMQLLIKYNPPVGWLPYCIIIADGPVSAELQALPNYCGWVADNHPCGGWVYSNDFWVCDRYGYNRLPLKDLLRYR